MRYHRLLIYLGLFFICAGFVANLRQARVTTASAPPPTAQCADIFTALLNANGQRSIVAVQLDDGSSDPQGGFLWFKARRLHPGPCNSDSLFRSQILFCCADAGDTIDVVLRVYNVPVDTGGIASTFGAGNFDDCLVKVVVTEQEKPVLAALAPDTLSCEEYLAGFATYPNVSDNCCMDTILIQDQNITYDTSCKRGLVRRRFTARDCSGNTTTSTQSILVQSQQFYVVEFPDDAIRYGCTDFSPENLGQPLVYDGQCERMNISYIDTVSYQSAGAGPCMLIRRTWRVFNWCQYNASLPLTGIPNPAPHPDPLAPQNQQGPVVGPQGVATVSILTPADTAAQDFSAYWTPTVNGFRYTQLIRVYDTERPIGRATSPNTICDLSNNDLTLWQGGSWYYPPNNSNDLPECNAPITVKLYDQCAKNLNVRYALYLDLNGDQTRETLVQSQAPPPPGSVSFNNLNPGQAEERVFDRRIVGINFKYRFALEQIPDGDSLIARVRWNTMEAPNTFVPPQLPYGRHKIVWYFSDPCGNTDSLTHYFSISDDCTPPVVTCIANLTTSIPAPGLSATITPANLVLNVVDDWTPANLIQFAIEKAPFGNQFPLDPSGQAQSSVSFDCSETGFRVVRVWAADAFMNAAYCESLITVNDPLETCSDPKPAVKGAVTNVQGQWMKAACDLYQMPDTFLVHTSTTAPLSFYYFNDLVPLGNYFIRPRIDSSDLLNGVNTFDLILISRHILNLEPFDSPYKLIGGDVNRSGTVTTFDIVTARKAILGALSHFPGNTSWRFVLKNYQFSDPQNPFSPAFPEQLNLASIFQNVDNADFYAIKTGDVDLNAQANAVRNTDERSWPEGLQLQWQTDPLYPHRQYLWAQPLQALSGFQFVLGREDMPDFGHFVPSAALEDRYRIHHNTLRVSYEQAALAPLLLGYVESERQPECTLQHSPTLHSEAYAPDGTLLQIKWTEADTTQTVERNAAWVTPNPVTHTAHIYYENTTDEVVHLRVLNAWGSLVYQQRQEMTKGAHYLSLNMSDWPKGVYFFHWNGGARYYSSQVLKQ